MNYNSYSRTMDYCVVGCMLEGWGWGLEAAIGI
jgi:hypothetical protein